MVEPYNFISKVVIVKNSVHNHFQIMACCWIAMQVDTSSFLQHTPHWLETNCHIQKISRGTYFGIWFFLENAL